MQQTQNTGGTSGVPGQGQNAAGQPPGASQVLHPTQQQQTLAQYQPPLQQTHQPTTQQQHQQQPYQQPLQPYQPPLHQQQPQQLITRPTTHQQQHTQHVDDGDEDNNSKIRLPCSIPYGKELENLVWLGYVMNIIKQW